MGEKEGPPQPTVKCTLSFGHAMPKPLLALAGGKAGAFWLCPHHTLFANLGCRGMRRCCLESELEGKLPVFLWFGPLVLPVLPHGP